VDQAKNVLVLIRFVLIPLAVFFVSFGIAAYTGS